MSNHVPFVGRLSVFPSSSLRVKTSCWYRSAQLPPAALRLLTRTSSIGRGSAPLPALPLGSSATVHPILQVCTTPCSANSSHVQPFGTKEEEEEEEADQLRLLRIAGRSVCCGPGFLLPVLVLEARTTVKWFVWLAKRVE